MRCLVGWIFKFPVYKHLKCKYLASGMMNAIHRDMAFSTANIKNTTSNVNGFVLRWKHSSIIFTIAEKRNSLAMFGGMWEMEDANFFPLANIDKLWMVQLNYFAKMGFFGAMRKLRLRFFIEHVCVIDFMKVNLSDTRPMVLYFWFGCSQKIWTSAKFTSNNRGRITYILHHISFLKKSCEVKSFTFAKKGSESSNSYSNDLRPNKRHITSTRPQTNNKKN